MKKTNKNILAKCHPDLIRAEWCWDYNNVLGLDPHQITVSSTKPVFWTCTGCNSIYLMAPKKRLEAAERSKTSCFACRGKVQIHPFTV